MINSCRCGLAVLVLILVPVIGTAETPPPATSGIEGTISVSPSRPGPIRKDGPTSAPAPDLQFVVKNGESTVARFTTDAEGHFQVSLPPGHYVVLREDAGAAMGHWHFEADVIAGKVAKVQWTGDSGMR